MFLIKIFFVCICLIIIRGTLPRYRMDAVAYKAWKEWVLVWVVLVLINSATAIAL